VVKIQFITATDFVDLREIRTEILWWSINACYIISFSNVYFFL